MCRIRDVTEMFELRLRFRASRSWLNRRALGPRLFAVIAETEQGMFAVDAEDGVVGRLLISDGRYGERELERLMSHVSSESSVLVVGAHIGDVLL
jgi:hypothetical protein